MFTFSFSSAFAAVDWTGEATSKYLTEAGDYDLNSTTASSEKGTEGITEAYRAELLDQIGAWDKASYYAGFYAPEKAKAKELVAACKEAVKSAKTAKEAAKLVEKAEDNLDALKAGYDTAESVIENSTEKLNLSRLTERYDTVENFYLPGYGTVAAEKHDTALNALGLDFVKTWLMDNDYRTDSEMAGGLSALVAALVPMTETYMDTVKAEQYAIQSEIYKYADKYNTDHAKNKLTVADLEGIDALIVKMDDFEDKYEGLTGINDFNVTDFETAIKYLAEKYFDVYCAEVSALPAVSKLAATDKAKVLELNKKVNALEDTYENVWDYLDEGAEDYACNYSGLQAAYEYFIKEDVKAFGKLDDFEEKTSAGAGKYYFDASEKNVNALKAQRAAFDALVADYGYDDLNDFEVGGMSYREAAAAEALILAAEHNMPADAAYDVKDNTKLQNYLNNATVKVTTKALGNKKVRVQARFDAETYKDIVAQLDEGDTITYQFYYKKAANTTYKAGKVKDVNYTTFKLVKGVKYNFQCKVVIKDANGNVIASKDYKASTVGTRTVK